MNPIIIALDCETAAEARAIVDATSKSVGYYKVGLELYAAAGNGVCAGVAQAAEEGVFGFETPRHRRNGAAGDGADREERR